jgi:N-acetylmuramoyl-L-alanine amidase
MITKEKLVDLIEDLELSDEELLQYIQIDENNSDAFNIAFKGNPNKVLNLSTADEGLLGFLNKRSRKRRQRKYEKKIRKGFNGIRIVSEGDSWFQYPVFLKDIIDNLNDNDAFAIYSLGYGGDWLSNIYREQEYLRALREKQPSVFLFSGGGNDFAGKNRIATMVHSYEEGRSPDDYLNEESALFFADIKSLYKKIFDVVTEEFPNMKIIFHGYDYAIPKNGNWLGKPLESRGIENTDLQQEIIKLFMDRFNEIQIGLAANYENVHHVDLRGTIIEAVGWHDELHPTNHYFEQISNKIESAIVGALEIG